MRLNDEAQGWGVHDLCFVLSYWFEIIHNKKLKNSYLSVMKTSTKQDVRILNFSEVSK